MKKEKLLKKAIKTPQNIRFDEFKGLLEHYGFQFKKVKGSHFVYSHFKNDKTKCSQEIMFFEIAFRARGHYISSSC